MRPAIVAKRDCSIRRNYVRMFLLCRGELDQFEVVGGAALFFEMKFNDAASLRAIKIEILHMTHIGGRIAAPTARAEGFITLDFKCRDLSRAGGDFFVASDTHLSVYGLANSGSERVLKVGVPLAVQG